MTMDSESGCRSSAAMYKEKASLAAVLMLAYQSFGVVYGDLSVSPLYVFRATFARIREVDPIDEFEVYGVLSFVFWTFTLISVFKYALIVLNAQDNGEGGTFALYSLLCRHLKLGIVLNQQTADEALSAYTVERHPACTDDESSRRGLRLRQLFEKHKVLQNGLFIFVLLGTCMVIGDGALTPALSVLSAIDGIRVAAPSLHSEVVVVLSCVILVFLFGIQHIGTRRVSFLFAPVILAWLVCSAAIGVYNLIVWNPSVVKALNPYYMYYFFNHDGREGWISLGGVLLCITGLEAMYADLGHFSGTSIKIAFTGVVYPLLMLGYIGQAAYLSKNLDDTEHAFFRSVPEPVFWPVFVIATLASIVGSQAVISATFSIINQCMALGCFPHVKVVHTSKDIHGQIYIPEINWMMLILCLALTIGFRDVVGISNAYGVAVITVMLVTTCLMTLVIIYVWQRSLLLAFAFLFVFGSVEMLYLSTAYYKVPQGGWVPLVISGVFMIAMYVWNFGTTKKYEFDVQNKLSMKWLLEVGNNLGFVRVPGIGLIYTDLVSGVPKIFSHFINNLPAFHEVLVFVCMKSAPVPYVAPHERYLIGRIGPRESHMYRCVVRYGYKDVRGDEDDFENQLIANLAEFIQTDETSFGSVDQSYEGHLTVMGTTPELLQSQEMDDEESIRSMAMSQGGDSLRSMEWLSPQTAIPRRRVRFDIPSSDTDDETGRDLSEIRRELTVLSKARDAGVAYLMSHSYIKAKKSSSLAKRITINYAYTFLRKNSRDPAIACNIPHSSLIEVGMFYYV